jgi:hypothetical protein
MTKKERIEDLLTVDDLGKTKTELDKMKAGEVEALHNKHFETESEMKVGETSAIISKRHDEKVFWLANGAIIPFGKCSPQSKKPGQSPMFKAKDLATKTKDGYDLSKKED